jgi:hypothetical protein
MHKTKSIDLESIYTYYSPLYKFHYKGNQLCLITVFKILKNKKRVKQYHYKPGQALRVPGG